MTHISDEAFLLKTLSVSLHCLTPSKDALYDLQLFPEKNQSGPAVLWSVYAQYARNAEPLKWATKFKKESYAVAYDGYREVLAERLGHGYALVPCARESALGPKLSLVFDKVASGLPKWEGLKEFFLGTAAYLTSQLGSRAQHDLPTTALLADLAYGSPEGVPDAISQVRDSVGAEAIHALFSPEIKAWLKGYLYETTLSQEQDIFDKLYLLCHQT